MKIMRCGYPERLSQVRGVLLRSRLDWRGVWGLRHRFDGLQRWGSGALILEGLRTLTSYRKMACGKETTSNADFQEHLDWCAFPFPVHIPARFQCIPVIPVHPCAHTSPCISCTSLCVHCAHPPAFLVHPYVLTVHISLHFLCIPV